MNKENIDTNSLAHTKWNCKYHIVFAPNIGEKYFTKKKDGRYEEYSDNYVNGKE